MKLRSFRTFLTLLMPILAVCSFAVWNVLTQPKPIYSFKVNIPKAFNPNFTDAELWEFIESGHEIPTVEFNKRNLPIPYYDKFLEVSLKKDGKIKINLQDIGTLENTNPLTDLLNKFFTEREENNVFEPNSNNVEKAVIIKAPRSAKYGDVVKVIDAVKISGADPIVLQIDDLPE